MGSRGQVSGFLAHSAAHSKLPTGLPDSWLTALGTPVRSPVYHPAVIGPFSPMGLPSQAGAPLRVEARLSQQGCPTAAAWVPRTPNHSQFSSRPPERRCSPPAEPRPAQGSLPPHTCARSLRVCCKPSPSSVSRAACSWSRRDSWSDVGETKKRWSGSMPSLKLPCPLPSWRPCPSGDL